MKVEVKAGRWSDEKGVLVIWLTEQPDGLGPEARAIDKAIGGRLRSLAASREFSGKQREVAVVQTDGKAGPERLILAGLGKEDEVTHERLRQAAARAAQRVREFQRDRFAALLYAGKRLAPEVAAQATVEGTILGLYRFMVYKTDRKDEPPEISEMTVLVENDRQVRPARSGAERGRIIAEAVNLSRDLGNQPSNILTPTRLAQIAQEIAAEAGLTCEVLEREQMERLGMGALLGVARGSHEPPKLITLTYTGGRPKDRPLALVGKTITFDTGGISLKPSDKMEQMKDDMLGGAAVLCAMKVAAQFKLPVNIVGLMPATENMPGGHAIKPGDVLKSMSGKTIEVINTDAEGRLILSDALTYAGRYKPQALVDIATLTGACSVALGNYAIGLLGNDAKLIETIKQAADRSGERVWELPLWEEYYDQIKSDVADLKNVGGRPAGTITAAAFLSRFVGDYPWAHLDIASTSWAEEARGYVPKGPTGVGVRLLVQFLSDRAATGT